ncbi:MAG: hypothetical protein HOP29_02095 [Phycisphaerales bacterium]|nr:hypothetical protein [Phycisphaerales bacterium]
MSVRGMSTLLVTALVLGGGLLGCETPPQDKTLGTPLEPTSMHRFYEPMIDNGAAHDMSVADVHFVPHNTELNDLGTHRLDRLILVLDRYGGTVRYETLETDEDMMGARLASVERYLATAGLDMSRVEVKSMMSGGRGTTAARAAAAEMKLEDSIKGGKLESTAAKSQQ